MVCLVPSLPLDPESFPLPPLLSGKAGGALQLTSYYSASRFNYSECALLPNLVISTAFFSNIISSQWVVIQ